jgi:acyl carrier protein
MNPPQRSRMETDASVTEALVVAMDRVVPGDVVVEASTPLDQTTLDSLGMLEVMVHLEELVGLGFDEETVRTIALEPDYDPTMQVSQLAALLLRLSPALADGTSTATAASRPPRDDLEELA